MKARILVVDDEEIVVRSCLRILGEGDYEVEGVQSGEEALRRIEEHPVRRRHTRHHDAEDGRSGSPAAREGVAPRYRRHHGHRAVADRYGGALHEARRFRLSAEAVRSGRTEGRGGAGPGAAATAAGEPEPEERGELALPHGEHHRLEPGHAGGLPSDRKVRSHQQHRPAHRGKRHGQGTDRARQSTTTACARTSRSCPSTAIR